MRHFTAEDIDRLAPFGEVVNALDDAYRSYVTAPPRHHHAIDNLADCNSTLLIMPAWRAEEAIGVKIVTVRPASAHCGGTSVSGVYFWQDARTGKPLAILDGGALTARRTAGASALAARYLAREDARTHLIAGTGALALPMMQAHATQRPINKHFVWGRTSAKAKAVAEAALEHGLNAEPVDDLESAARTADIITCATFSQKPLVQGGWLKSGAHLDLVGAFKPEMRESDDDAVKRATLFCDSKKNAPRECGDLASPIATGVISDTSIAADLHDLAAGAHPGRTLPDEITLYKSVGNAIQDYAVASLVWKKSGVV